MSTPPKHSTIIPYVFRAAPLSGTWAIVYSIMWGLGSVLVAKAMGWSIDKAIIPAITTGTVTLDTIALIVGPLMGAAIIMAVGIFGRRAFAWRMQFDVQTHHREMLVQAYLRKSMEWHRNHPKGRLIAYVSSDAETAAAICGPLPMGIGTIFLALFAVIGMAMTDWMLTIVMLIMLPVLMVVNTYFQRLVGKSVRRVQEAKASVSSIAQESFEAALMIKTMGKQRAEYQRFEEASQALRDRSITLGNYAAFFIPIYTLIPTLGSLAVLYIGVLRIQGGYITPGDLMNMSFLISVTAMPMRILAAVLREIVRSSVASRRIRDVCNDDFNTTPGTDYLPRTEEGARIEIDHVTYEYQDASWYKEGFVREEDDELAAQAGDQQVDYSNVEKTHIIPDGRTMDEDDDCSRRGVSDITLTIEPGMTVALVGRTGSGKSTLASLIGDLLTPQQGRVLCDGVRVDALDDRSVANNIGFAFQKAFLFNDTITNNITLYDRRYTAQDIDRVVELTQLRDTIDDLPEGLETVVGERGTSLSGGQRQRVALARALLRQPRLLVLDDATSALDSTVELKVLSGLLEARSSSMTTLLVANRMSSIVIADHIVFMQEGRITDQGSHEELLARNSEYASIVRTYEEEIHA